MRGARILWCLLLTGSLCAQEEKHWFVGGYVKDMVTILVPEQGSSLVDNLVHHRLNIGWEPSSSFSARLELRNRYFTGDLVRLLPDYGAFIDVNNDYFDLSWMPVNNNQGVLHFMIDRLSLQYEGKDWSVIAGRQRINWGVNLVWNPNDIFNAYSFFDFDYEERPGTDAIRFQKYTGFASGYELAIKMADQWSELTASALFKTNFRGYDLQALLGVMQNSLVMGGGWAGSIKGAGFKGELSYFRSMDGRQQQELLVSLSWDYLFKNSLYLNGSFLFDSNPSPGTGFTAINLSNSNLDVRSLSPYLWSTFLQSSYTFHPLLSGGVAGIYFPGEPGIFLNPSLSWSARDNLDLDLIGQLLVGGEPEDFYAGYIRLKYSF